MTTQIIKTNFLTHMDANSNATFTHNVAVLYNVALEKLVVGCEGGLRWLSV